MEFITGRSDQSVQHEIVHADVWRLLRFACDDGMLPADDFGGLLDVPLGSDRVLEDVSHGLVVAFDLEVDLREWVAEACHSRSTDGEVGVLDGGGLGADSRSHLLHVQKL